MSLPDSVNELVMLYVPYLTRMVSPAPEASIAAWIVFLAAPQLVPAPLSSGRAASTK